jgi:hypothetical protein
VQQEIIVSCIIIKTNANETLISTTLPTDKYFGPRWDWDVNGRKLLKLAVDLVFLLRKLPFVWLESSEWG